MSSVTLTKSGAAAIERRADKALKTMTEVCGEAGVTLNTWSRAKARGTIAVKTIREINAALDRIEAA